MEIPPQWPPAVAQVYEPLRVLGRGGFASVLLARKKPTAARDDDDHEGDETNTRVQVAKNSPDEFAALKVVGSRNTTRTEVGYAHRELEILRELTHPNIMRLLEYWEPHHTNDEAKRCAAVMALSYAPGPTVELLLKKGGALSLVFARVITAQLVDAIGYLHSRAVIHRDIKPDNLVVTGASYDQDDIWDDDNDKNNNEVDWNALVKKWHLTLVDFGFARALTPRDMKKKLPPSPDNPSAGRMDLDSSSNSRRSLFLDRSTSRRFTRKMSALGHRSFAAPEILKDVKFDNNPSGHASLDVTKTLSDHVSRYGMMVDAYSLGSTIKYFVTGVSPNQNVNEVIAMENHPLLILGRFLCRCSSASKSNSSSERRVKYRKVSKLPAELIKLIKDLTHYDPRQRATVRTARRFPYVEEVLQGDDAYSLPARTSMNPQEIQYLQLALQSGEQGGPAAAAAADRRNNSSRSNNVHKDNKSSSLHHHGSADVTEATMDEDDC